MNKARVSLMAIQLQRLRRRVRELESELERLSTQKALLGEWIHDQAANPEMRFSMQYFLVDGKTKRVTLTRKHDNLVEMRLFNGSE